MILNFACFAYIYFRDFTIFTKSIAWTSKSENLINIKDYFEAAEQHKKHSFNTIKTLKSLGDIGDLSRNITSKMELIQHPKQQIQPAFIRLYLRKFLNDIK